MEVVAVVLILMFAWVFVTAIVPAFLGLFVILLDHWIAAIIFVVIVCLIFSIINSPEPETSSGEDMHHKGGRRSSETGRDWNNAP